MKDTQEQKTGAESTNSTIENPVKAEFNPSEKADITQEQLNTILERVAKLESGDTRPKIIKPKFNTALVRFIDDKLVVGYGESWEELLTNPDAKTASYRLMTEVKVKDGEKIKVKKVDWLKFRQTGKQLEVKILSVNMNETEVKRGSTTLKNVDYANFKTVDTGIEVPMTVVIPDPIYTVEMPDGEKVELSHEALN